MPIWLTDEVVSKVEPPFSSFYIFAGPIAREVKFGPLVMDVLRVDSVLEVTDEFDGVVGRAGEAVEWVDEFDIFGGEGFRVVAPAPGVVALVDGTGR